MANTINPDYEKDLALTCEELAELERAKKCRLFLTKIVRKLLRKKQ